MERRIYFDLSSLASTSAGSAVYAWELCHRLMRLAKPLQLIPFTSPFKTEGKRGLSRTANAILRDTIWQNLLSGMEATEKDYFIFPTPNVPRKFYNLNYAVFILDLGNWHNRSYLQLRGKLTTLAIPKALKNANHIFAISNYTAQDVAQEFKLKEQVIVAPCGLSNIYKLDAKELKAMYTNEDCLPEQYFLHVGTFEPKKNLLFLLKAYEKFRERAGTSGDKVKLLLTGGESWKSSQFFEQIRNSTFASDITILGRVDAENLFYLYAGALALVFPSIFEGFGLPVIEALSQGTPALVNSNTSLSQFGEFGATVFDNFDADIWAKELEEIFRGKKLNSKYPDKVRNYFDWDRTATIVWDCLSKEMT